MSEFDRYKRKADELLRKAALTADAAERGTLVDQAAHWHRLALEACSPGASRPAAPARPDAGGGGAKNER